MLFRLVCKKNDYRQQEGSMPATTTGGSIGGTVIAATVAALARYEDRLRGRPGELVVEDRLDPGPDALLVPVPQAPP